MKQINKVLLLSIALSFFIVGCKKEEKAIEDKNPIPTEVQWNTADIGSNYENQVWFNLSNNQVVKSNNILDWDIAFDSESDVIYLNSALNASVAFTGINEFENVNADPNLEYNYEHQSGMKDSLAIGDVSQLQEVLLIRRGFSPTNDSLESWKFQLIEIKDGAYHFAYAELGSSSIDTAIVAKNSAFNKVAFSFVTGKEIQIEPQKESFDLCFTKYTHIFYANTDTTQIQVATGVLLNSYKTHAAKINNLEFGKVTKEVAESAHLSNDLNAIGYDWKVLSLSDFKYNVKPDVYVIKDSSGDYYKLQFTGFYNEQDEKGHISFDFEKL